MLLPLAPTVIRQPPLVPDFLLRIDHAVFRLVVDPASSDSLADLEEAPRQWEGPERERACFQAPRDDDPALADALHLANRRMAAGEARFEEAEHAAFLKAQLAFREWFEASRGTGWRVLRSPLGLSSAFLEAQAKPEHA